MIPYYMIMPHNYGLMSYGHMIPYLMSHDALQTGVQRKSVVSGTELCKASS